MCSDLPEFKFKFSMLSQSVGLSYPPVHLSQEKRLDLHSTSQPLPKAQEDDNAPEHACLRTGNNTIVPKSRGVMFQSFCWRGLAQTEK